MKEREKGNFEFVKEEDDKKRNYIFQKDKITKIGFYIVTAILLLLVISTLFFGLKLV